MTVLLACFSKNGDRYLRMLLTATLRDHAPFDEAARLSRKAGRQSFTLPA